MDSNAEVDSTLVFEKEMLDNVFEKTSPSVVAILLDPMSTGFIVKTSNTHNIIAVNGSLLGIRSKKREIRIRYSDGITAASDRIEYIPGSPISLLYSPHLGKPRQAVKFGELEDTECQKVVTLFPYKDDLMLCKGHITFTDCTSEDRSGQIVPGAENLFMFTCPVSASYDLDVRVNPEERRRFLRMIIGAAVFDLDGRVLGRIHSNSFSHHLKFATKSSAFRASFNTLGPLDWQVTSQKIGYTGEEKRSLLSSMENYTALHLQIGRSMRTPGDALTTLKNFIPRYKLPDVHGITLTDDGAGAVFDVPSGDVQDFIQGAENAAGVTLDEVKQLPALQEREQQSRGGGSRCGGGRRFGGGFGGRGGGRFGRR